MPTGKVKWFDSKKGYGFIKDNDSEKDIFLHVTSLEKSKLRVLKENQEIEFEIKEEKGKLQAVLPSSNDKYSIYCQFGSSDAIDSYMYDRLKRKGN